MTTLNLIKTTGMALVCAFLLNGNVAATEYLQGTVTAPDGTEHALIHSVSTLKMGFISNFVTVAYRSDTIAGNDTAKQQLALTCKRVPRSAAKAQVHKQSAVPGLFAHIETYKCGGLRK